MTGMESVSALPTLAIPPPGKEEVTKSEGASSEQTGKPLSLITVELQYYSMHSSMN